jgi:hypothetical protein
MPIFSEPITAMAGVAVLLTSLPRRRNLPTWRLTLAVILMVALVATIIYLVDKFFVWGAARLFQ